MLRRVFGIQIGLTRVCRIYLNELVAVASAHDRRSY